MALDEGSYGSPRRRYRDVGGTSGGLGMFVLGAVMAVAGGYVLLKKVTVTSHYWQVFGYDAFGLSLVPLILGIVLLFYDGRSILGWLLLLGGVAIVLAGILVNLTFFFQPTSLFDTLMILVLLAGGLGLVARSLRPG
ncbi:MAG: hypothetical protein IT305_20905 [Chloroflexi bacterium]|nr:hypothetical protein [Chloroflexota bacterium]